MPKQWYPILHRDDQPSVIGYTDSASDAVIVLNGDHKQDIKTLPMCWATAKLKIAVDGGTNFVYDELGTEQSCWPDIITGDFDSVRPEVLNFYREKQVSVHYTEDQNYTDFTKCLKVVSSTSEMGDRIKNLKRFVVFGAFGMRLDQTISNLNSLVMAKEFSDLPVWLMDDNQEVFLLASGEHEIHIKQPDDVSWCALVPLGQPILTTTTGLKWNLDRQTMNFGGIISTSNKVTSNIVTVKCDGTLLWMMGY